MALNEITANFSGGNTAEAEFRWQRDYGQILRIEGLDLPEYFEVHFSNNSYEPTKTQLGHDGEVIIPDEYLQDGADITAYIYLHEGQDDGETVYVIHIAVTARPPIGESQPTPVQQDIITEAIAALNEAERVLDGAAETVEEADKAAKRANDAAAYIESIRFYVDQTDGCLYQTNDEE